MENRILLLKKEKKYDEIIRLTCEMSPSECTSAELAHIIGKAYEKKKAFSQSIPWYTRSYEITPSDEALGMILGVCFAIGRYDEALKALETASGYGDDGYFYCAGRFELALRTNAGTEQEIATLEAFLDIQDEESYMIKLATLYLLSDREKEAARLCKKIGRLFVSGASVDYATKLLGEIKAGTGTEYIKENPWIKDYVFKHIDFDLTKPVQTDVVIQNQPVEEKVSAGEKEAAAIIPDLSCTPARKAEQKETKEQKEPKEKKDKIAPIIEKCHADLVGMQELKASMNNIFNIMQTSKKRAGLGAILKDNIRILGPDGCGKTTAANAAANALYQIGIIGDKALVSTDYFTLVGASSEETHENIQKLFEAAENGCIIIENIHEFDDAGAYALGLEAIDLLVKAYYAAEEKIPFVITGSEAEVNALFDKKRRFGELFNLPSIVLGKYTTEELVQIAGKIAEKKNLVLDSKVHDLLVKKLDYMAKQPDFKYSRDLDSMINEAYIQQVARIAGIRRCSDADYFVLKAEDFGTVETTETVEDLLMELDRMTGLTEVKKQVHKIVNQIKVQKLKEKTGISTGKVHGSLHLVFLGNPGTGKTTVARIIGKIYRRLGLLPSGQFVECTRKDLVSQYVGATSQKVADKVREAMGGILFIDEAYTLCKDDNDTFGKEAIEALLTDTENHRDSFMVILAGYSNDMEKFMDQNEGLRSRFPTNILFEDYSTEEMVQIFKKYVKNQGVLLDAGLDEDIYRLLDTKKKEKSFGNARGVRNVFEAVMLNQNNRLGEMDASLISKNDFAIIRREDLNLCTEKAKQTKNVDDYLDELNQLTGLASVKEKVNKIVSTVRVNQAMEAAGLKTQGFGTLHLVFKGNAGTGKTTVARLLGSIYRELGVLSSGQLIECDRSSLVGGYVGQTALKVKEKIQEALGGVLFIDEAYALAKGGDSFGQEAINTLVADIENYRSDLMVIIAGYSDDMDEFLNQNQGLRSRFSNEIIFEDYSKKELLQIFMGNIRSRKLVISDELEPVVMELLAKYSNTSDFGNARGVRNLVDKVCEQRNVRIADLLRMRMMPTKEELQTVLREDLECFL